jgi:hypothetical protein
MPSEADVSFIKRIWEFLTGYDILRDFEQKAERHTERVEDILRKED